MKTLATITSALVAIILSASNVKAQSVEILTFKGSMQNHYNFIDYVTVNQNLDRCVIEFSYDSLDYKQIAIWEMPNGMTTNRLEHYADNDVDKIQLVALIASLL